jgi:hypothetical protein
VNTEVPAHSLGGCNASQRNTEGISNPEINRSYRKSRRSLFSEEHTLGGIDRFRRVLRLQPRTRITRPESGNVVTMRNEREVGEKDLTMAATGKETSTRRREKRRRQEQRMRKRVGGGETR